MEQQNEVVKTLDVLAECLEMLSRSMQHETYTHNDAVPLHNKIAAARRHIKLIKQAED